MSYRRWLRRGIKKGWVDAPVCETHEGIRMTDEELKAFDEGFDPCITVVRLRAHEDES
jgi:hypothetical protein